MQKNFFKKISCILFVVGLSACSTKESSIHAILSWKQEPLQSAQEVVQQLSDQKIQRLYQYPNTWEISAWDELGKQCQKQKIELYAMIGEPEWVLEKNGTSLMKMIDQIDLLNHSLSQGKITGIMLDIEPYALKEWNEDQEEILDDYVELMQYAYTHAQKYNLQVVACIPYFYDSLGYKKQLEELMPYCDEIAIMNYQKQDEWGQIEGEVALASTYDKAVSVLYELQDVGVKELDQNQTYAEDGLFAVSKSFSALQKKSHVSLGIGYHEYQSYQKLRQKEIHDDE